MPPPGTRMAEPVYKKPFLKSVTESGMAPALTGALPPSALKSVQKIPVLLILTTLLFPPPSPCLALPSSFPPRQPPVVCGKISQYLVVCSPGHHQVVFGCPGSSKPDLGHPVTDHHVRILTQRVKMQKSKKTKNKKTL